MKEETKRIVKCPCCGKEKEIIRYQWKRSKTGLFFCDNKCSGQYYRKHPIEEKKCKYCGLDKHPKNGICDNHFFQRPVNLQRLGFDISKIGTPEIFDEYNKLKVKIEDLYHKELKSLLEIKEIFKIPSERSLGLLFNFLDIKTRNLSECHYNGLKTGRMKIPTGKNQFITGWHTSWEGNEIYYRSSYELDYMKALDEAKVSYQGENCLRIEYFDTQVNKIRIAIPDFYLPESNTIVEIKGNWTYNPQNMIDKVKAYREAGYNFKLILEHKEIDI